MLTTLRQIIDCNAMNGNGHWFSKGSMRFFATRLSAKVYPFPGGAAFVTSEQGPHGPRLYSVRTIDEATGSVETVGTFQGYATARAAQKAAEAHAYAKGGRRSAPGECGHLRAC